MSGTKHVAVMVALLLAIVLSSSCATGKEVTLTITAKYLANDQPIQCPTTCMEVDNPKSGSDTTKPLSFEVCSASTGCFQLESGTSAKVHSNATIKAPDGISRGQQLPALEKDVYLKFQKWNDGVGAFPRTLGSTADNVDLIAYYAAWEPATVATTSSGRGCGNDVEIFLGTGAQWAPVQDQPEFNEIEGPVTDSHVSDTDFYGNHNSNDVNMWVLLSGEEVFKMLSRNVSGQYGQRSGQIVVEWEEGSYPTWAWASRETVNQDEPAVPKIDDADYVWVKGKWIFDCGHEDDQILQGAWTEIHPPLATAVMRGTREGKLFLKDDVSKYFPDLHKRATGLQGVQVDLWINGDGGGAVESVKCAMTWAAGMGCVFTPVFDIRGVYEFDVPLPPAPSPLYSEAKFRVKFLRLQSGQPQPVVTPAVVTSSTTELHVKVDLSNYTDTWQTCTKQNTLYGENLVNCHGDAYGVTIIAGWEIFSYPPDLHRVRAIINGIQIFDDMEGEDGDGEYKLWLEAGPAAALGGDPLNPTIVALHNLNPGLNDAAGDGESYPLLQNNSPLMFLFNIRENSTESNKLRLLLDGYEDDPVWDDEIRDLLRVFYSGYSLWDPDNGYPDWAAQPPMNCTTLPPASCTYGKETRWGTVRGTSTPPIRYGDQVWGDCSVPCFNHLLDYTIEELALP